jgi:hypothetical protein
MNIVVTQVVAGLVYEYIQKQRNTQTDRQTDTHTHRERERIKTRDVEKVIQNPVYYLHNSFLKSLGLGLFTSDRHVCQVRPSKRQFSFTQST